MARSEAAKGFTVPQSSLPPHPKNPNFRTNPGRKSCHSRGGKHIHPFIGGTRDGRGGTVQGNSRCPRGKPWLREAGKGSCPCQGQQQRNCQRRATKPSVSQGRGAVSLLSHEEFITVDSLDVDTGRDGVGFLQGQQGASRRGRRSAFWGPFLQILWEQREGTRRVRGKGWSCQGAGNARGFPVAEHHLPLRQLVDEQLDPGRLGGHAHPLVLLQGEAARP